ncbi:hypothetical protein D3C83_28640 [compost metagenome]
MKEQLDRVSTFHLQRVLDGDPARPLVERDAPSVEDRVVETQVAVMPALEHILLEGT